MSAQKRRTTPPAVGPPTKRVRSPSTPISPLASTSRDGSKNGFEWLEPIGERSSVLHARYGSPAPSDKIAAFDFVGTLIEPISTAKYCQTRDDWRCKARKKKKRDDDGSSKTPEVIDKLRALYDGGFAIVIFSSAASFDETLREVVEAFCVQLDVPLDAFFSTDYDVYRKPCIGMWREFEQDWNGGETINIENSFFVSHAGGLGKLDYSRKFALNVSVPFYTPQEFFFDEEYDARWTLGGFRPKDYDHSGPVFLPTSSPLVTRRASEFDDPVCEIILFVGRPACGKTSLFHRIFEQKGYKRIVTGEAGAIAQRLASRPLDSLYVIDAPLATRVERVNLIKSLESISSDRVARSLPRFKLRGFDFVVAEDVCKHNSQFAELWDRLGTTPTPEGKDRSFVEEEAFTEWRMAYQAPHIDEGFDEVKEIFFRFDDQWPDAETGRERLENWNKFGDCYRRDWITS